MTWKRILMAYDLNNLAVTLFEAGRYAEAEPLMHRAIPVYEATLGKNHPDVAGAWGNLAILRAAQNDWRGALTCSFYLKVLVARAFEELCSTAARSPTQDRRMASIMSQAEHDLMIFTVAFSLMDAPLLPAVRIRRRGFKTRQLRVFRGAYHQCVPGLNLLARHAAQREAP